MIRIQHAVDAANGLAVAIGGVGMGKTFISRKILEKFQAEESRYEACLLILIHHQINPNWLLKKIGSQLGVEFPSEEKGTLIGQICDKLIEIYESGKRAVILIDEAHMIRTKEPYEELRGLLNFESNNKKLLNIVLFGTPELENNIHLDPIIVSRIGLKFTLRPFDEKSANEYIKHRLSVAGTTKEIFTAEASKRIYICTKGIPRIINAVCDNALLEGFIQKKTIIEPQTIDQIASDLNLPNTDLS
jgi:type II secretory pathway predicted ATPase ExeA